MREFAECDEESSVVRGVAVHYCGEELVLFCCVLWCRKLLVHFICLPIVLLLRIVSSGLRKLLWIKSAAGNQTVNVIFFWQFRLWKFLLSFELRNRSSPLSENQFLVSCHNMVERKVVLVVKTTRRLGFRTVVFFIEL